MEQSHHLGGKPDGHGESQGQLTVGDALNALREQLSAAWPYSRWFIAGILAATALLYTRCLGNAFVFDDLWMIRFNDYIAQWSFLWHSLVRDSWWFKNPNSLPQSSYYRPLQDIWLGLNYHLFGFNPAGWHAAMVALHLVVVWLVYKVSRLIVSNDATALITALFFALMPIHTEAVVWAAAIPLPLSTALMLAAFYCFLRRNADSWRDWIWPLVFNGLALLTHESAVVFPGLIAAYVFLLEPRDQPLRDSHEAELLSARSWRAIVAMAPFVAETIVYLAIRIPIVGSLTYRHVQPIYASVRVVLLTVPWDFLHFLELMAVPGMAGPGHDVRYVTDWSSPKFWLVLIAFVAIAGLLTLSRYKKRTLYCFCALWFFLTLVPEIGLIRGFPFAFVQDRYLYLPSFGASLLIADVLTTAVSVGGRLRKAAVATLVAVTGLYAIALFHAEYWWHDDLTYFTYCVTVVPAWADGHHGLAIALVERDRLKESLEQLRIGTRLDPSNHEILFDQGVVEAHLGDYSDAVRDMRKAVMMYPNLPPKNYASLANDADAAGQPDVSEAALRVLERLVGGAKLAKMTRAQIDLRHGRTADASRILDGLSAEYPSDAQVWALLGSTREAMGDYPGALVAYRRMAILAPDFSAPYYLTAEVLHRMGRDTEALANCRAALKINPGDPATRALVAQIQEKGSVLH